VLIKTAATRKGENLEIESLASIEPFDLNDKKKRRK
jgi:hypothetical protein